MWFRQSLILIVKSMNWKKNIQKQKCFFYWIRISMSTRLIQTSSLEKGEKNLEGIIHFWEVFCHVLYSVHLTCLPFSFKLWNLYKIQHEVYPLSCDYEWIIYLSFVAIFSKPCLLINVDFLNLWFWRNDTKI